jgi:hypothetical protein
MTTSLRNPRIEVNVIARVNGPLRFEPDPLLIRFPAQMGPTHLHFSMEGWNDLLDPELRIGRAILPYVRNGNSYDVDMRGSANAGNGRCLLEIYTRTASKEIGRHVADLPIFMIPLHD